MWRIDQQMLYAAKEADVRRLARWVGLRGWNEQRLPALIERLVRALDDYTSRGKR